MKHGCVINNIILNPFGFCCQGMFDSFQVKKVSRLCECGYSALSELLVASGATRPRRRYALTLALQLEINTSFEKPLDKYIGYPI